MCRKDEWNQPSKVPYLLAGGLDFWHMIFRLFYRCAVREWVLMYRTRGAQGTYVFYMYEYARSLSNSTRLWDGAGEPGHAACN